MGQPRPAQGGGGIKAAFVKHAREDLGLNQEPEE